MKNCGHCHTCGSALRTVLDGEEWCPTCQTYRRYPAHGWARGACSDTDGECPVLTPDGRLLRRGMCLCSMHCPNNCEPACCPEGTPWCSCSCHEERYRKMQEAQRAQA